MARRQFAADFYAGASEAQIRGYLAAFDPPRLGESPSAGIVPHAGWSYSGAVAAKVFQTIKSRREPESFVLFGTVHRPIRASAVYSRGSWATPFGDVRIDEGLADSLLEHAGAILERDEPAHDGEHSIEVQMPFVKHFFPRAAAVPISVLPDDDAAKLGGLVGEFLREHNIDAVVVGTTDLTHYGDPYRFTPEGYGPEAHEWMKRNDARIVKLAADMRAEEIVPEANRSMNACGAGAMAATVAAAKALGCARGLTVEYTTSYDVAPRGQFQMAVGYVGMIFCPS
jgi:AmmeMemoRadiSam system protein B